jgi:hypothetical protein
VQTLKALLGSNYSHRITSLAPLGAEAAQTEAAPPPKRAKVATTSKKAKANQTSDKKESLSDSFVAVDREAAVGAALSIRSAVDALLAALGHGTGATRPTLADSAAAHPPSRHRHT